MSRFPDSRMPPGYRVHGCCRGCRSKGARMQRRRERPSRESPGRAGFFLSVRGLTSQNLLWKLPGAVGGARVTGGGRHKMSRVWVPGSPPGTSFHGYRFRAGSPWCQGENGGHPGFRGAFEEPQEARGLAWCREGQALGSLGWDPTLASFSRGEDVSLPAGPTGIAGMGGGGVSGKVRILVLLSAAFLFAGL